MLSSCDEVQEVLKGKLCVAVWPGQEAQSAGDTSSLSPERTLRTFLLQLHRLLTSDQGEDCVPLLGRKLFLLPQPVVWVAEAGGEQLPELLQRLGLLLRAGHHGQEHLPVGLHHIPQPSAAVQALLELRDHAGHPAETAHPLYCVPWPSIPLGVNEALSQVLKAQHLEACVGRLNREGDGQFGAR